jgi:hypothetical protein
MSEFFEIKEKNFLLCASNAYTSGEKFLVYSLYLFRRKEKLTTEH